MSNTQVQCPNCGSFATVPILGLSDELVGIFVSPKLVLFDNPKVVQRFMKGKLKARCNTCKYVFDANTRPRNTIAENSLNVGIRQSVAERLTQAEELRAKGFLTEEEYKRKREDILRDL